MAQQLRVCKSTPVKKSAAPFIFFRPHPPAPRSGSEIIPQLQPPLISLLANVALMKRDRLLPVKQHQPRSLAFRPLPLQFLLRPEGCGFSSLDDEGMEAGPLCDITKGPLLLRVVKSRQVFAVFRPRIKIGPGEVNHFSDSPEISQLPQGAGLPHPPT